MMRVPPVNLTLVVVASRCLSLNNRPICCTIWLGLRRGRLKMSWLLHKAPHSQHIRWDDNHGCKNWIEYQLWAWQISSTGYINLYHGKNVILVSPCGSGKLLVYYLDVHLLRKKFNLPNGVGICLQPLNNILYEKTNGNPPMNTTFVTMTGEAIKSGNTNLSHSLDEIMSGEVGCILGDAESFLSMRGTFMFVSQVENTEP